MFGRGIDLLSLRYIFKKLLYNHTIIVAYIPSR